MTTSKRIQRLTKGQLVVLWVTIGLVSWWLNGIRVDAIRYVNGGVFIEHMYNPNTDTPILAAERQRSMRAKTLEAERRQYLAQGTIVLLLGAGLATTWVWFGRPSEKAA